MESSGRTLVCSVLFLDIVEYSKKPVAEQLQLKQAFNRTLAAALEQVAVRDRIILDTGDGAAVTFMGDPEDALFAAMTVRDGAGVVPMRLGINLGAVRLVKDLNGQMNIIGDGINVAQRVMSFATPGQLMVSRSFYEVVSCLSRDYANLFRHEGARTDKHVREHDVYSVVGAPAPRQPGARSEPGTSLGGWFARPGLLGLRRSALVAAPVAFLALLAGGTLAARALMKPAEPPQIAMLKSIAPEPPAAPAAPAAPATPAAAPAPAPKPAVKPLDELFPPKAAPAAKPLARVEKKPERKADKPAAAPRAAAVAKPGRLELAVLPWGEVFVDGKSRGVSPPLRELEIPAGPHTIEIRNTTLPAYNERVVVKAGETVRIRHRFR